MEDGQAVNRQEKSPDHVALLNLWTAMRYSKYFKPEYEDYPKHITQFAQFEQLYMCMVAGVSNVKIRSILMDETIRDQMADALEALWKETMKKPAMPTEKQDEQLKGMMDYIQRLELQVTQIQVEMSRIGTDMKRSRMAAKDNVTDSTGGEPELQQESHKPEKKNRTGSPFRDIPGRGTGRQTENLERRIKELSADMDNLKEKVDALKEDGIQVRGIVLTNPDRKAPFAKWKGRKRMEDEKKRIDGLLAEGYEADQLDFILSCREEGITWDIIECFAGREIPVGMMKKLKDYYTQKEENDVPKSGTQEGADDGK